MLTVPVKGTTIGEDFTIPRGVRTRVLKPATFPRRALCEPARHGFTLVEMLIVAALIALFSAIAIIGIQAQFEANQRKAIIGESRQVAQALDFAYNDIGFFPKIAHLQASLTTLQLDSEIKYGGNEDAIFSFLDSLGINVLPGSPLARQSRENWRGPYFAASQSRTRVSQGKGGSVKMITTPSDNVGFDWPVDVWNNPYMHYVLNVDRTDSANPTLYFANQTQDDSGNIVSLNRPGVEGNFITAVVSYGPNQVPGGGSLFQSPGDSVVPNDGSPWGLRMYYGNPNDKANPKTLKRGPDLLDANSNGRAIANAWTRLFAQNAGNLGQLADSDDPDPVDIGDGILSTKLGITDTGSDDVVFDH